MEKKVREAARLRAMTEYRDFSDVEKVVKMCNEKGVSDRVAAKACSLSRRAVERAKKAVQENRNIGLSGRPRLLASEYEVELVRLIDETEAEQKHLTMEEVQEKVCVPSFLFPHSKHSISHTLSPFRPRIYTGASPIKTSLKAHPHSLDLILIECLQRISSKRKLESLLNKYISFIPSLIF
jgi:hypothetical protein